MRMTLLAIGRLKAGPEREFCTRYESRFGQLAKGIGLEKLKMIELAESPGRRSEDRMAEEARALLAAIADAAFLIAMDERGASLSSSDFAKRIAVERDKGRADCIVLIGGADGLDASLRSRADLVLSFGAMTMPHQLVRIALLEQLYRAATILSGHPYHRA